MSNYFVSSFMFKSGVAGPAAGSWVSREQTEGLYSSESGWIPAGVGKGPTTLGNLKLTKRRPTWSHSRAEDRMLGVYFKDLSDHWKAGNSV